MLNLQRKSKLFFESLPSYHCDYIDVGNGHKIYYEQYGNPKGKPILFLHGGLPVVHTIGAAIPGPPLTLQRSQSLAALGRQ